VIAAMAVAAGVRALICTIDVPSRIVDVVAPHHASGVSASEPYASAVHTESNPSRSASASASATPGGGPFDQYPVVYPSLTSALSGIAPKVGGRRAGRRDRQRALSPLSRRRA
jgi:hypothetical protein